VLNGSGIVTKWAGDAGARERTLAEQYDARAVADGWPRTASVLRRIARAYEEQARAENIDVELHDNLQS
jgi:hypothetical protein